jgi:peptide/nickel transport system ATP-binding protein
MTASRQLRVKLMTLETKDSGQEKAGGRSLHPVDVILKIKGLKKHFPVRKGILQRVANHVRAVDGIDFEIKRGETLSLVGESGCGKSTVGRMISRLEIPTEGEILYASSRENDLARTINIESLSDSQTKALRKNIQLIFQDPYSSLNPRMTTQQIIGEPLYANDMLRGKKLKEKVQTLMSDVGLSAEQMKRYPHEFSGGQRQRIGIARALAVGPELVVADEPVSALDSSVQAQVLNLLQDMQEKHGLTLLFITHDLSVVKHLSDRVAVMYLGKIVEIADTLDLFSKPKHPYTEALISVAPVPNPRLKRKHIILEGDVPNPLFPPKGCYFHPRCRYAIDICKTTLPELIEHEDGHWASCHRTDTLELQHLQIPQNDIEQLSGAEGLLND